MRSRGEIMRKLSSELNLTVSTKSFMYVKDIIDHYVNHKSDRAERLWEMYRMLANKYEVSIEAVNMGVFRYLQSSIKKIREVYPNIDFDEYTVHTKEILVRLADICEEKGCEF